MVRIGKTKLLRSFSFRSFLLRRGGNEKNHLFHWNVEHYLLTFRLVPIRTENKGKAVFKNKQKYTYSEEVGPTFI
jgi:hypothetical protein